jgi:hypothetical protein
VTNARKKTAPAIAYLRTSSAANVGADKHSDKRQRAAIEAFAKRSGFEIVAEFYDAAVSGADPTPPPPRRLASTTWCHPPEKGIVLDNAAAFLVA